MYKYHYLYTEKPAYSKCKNFLTIAELSNRDKDDKKKWAEKK